MANQLPPDYFVTSLQYTRKSYQDVYPAIDPKSPSNSLSGKIAIITGASRGIGARGIAPSFAQAGIQGLVLVARDEKKLRAIESDILKINPAVDTLVVALDVSDSAAVKELYDKIQKKYGRHADILVNNAAVNSAVNSGGPVLHEASIDEWWLNFEVNVKGYFVVAKYFISSLPTPTTPATIINLTSSAAWLLYPMVDGYSISKLAGQQWTAMIDAAYGGRITAVSIHPGLVDTDMQLDVFRRMNLDSPALTGGLCVWVAANPSRAQFLSGRAINVNWDVEELLQRKDEIVAKDELKMKLAGKLGSEQFENK
ncbi:hypothetical protein F5884DRAFT_853496 [Xylogone sp. PMI_703]|nr:hypothetical protein F5884DRAFT_853496 [Xylogone sp. PMI_703]